MVIGLSSPLLVGVYLDGKLIETIQSEDKTSDVLPKMFQDILSRYEVKELLFARGPGSFMAIKITYLFLKTLQIVKNIPLKACDGFRFNNNSPIKAVGNLYFIKEDDKITTKIFKEAQPLGFSLPQTLENLIFGDETEPLYHLPAI